MATSSKLAACIGALLALPVIICAILFIGNSAFNLRERMLDARDRSHSNLMQLAFAMHDYQNLHGRLPPAVLYNTNGKALHSWRVLLLPFLGKDPLFRQFRLNEAWDSEHNIKLLSSMPALYAPPARRAHRVPPYHTVCHVFVGKGTAFEGRLGNRIPEDFPDGAPNTFLIVEAGTPVLWTKPDEIVFKPHQPFPKLEGVFDEGFRAVMGDCALRWIEKDSNPMTLQAAVTRNGGESLEGVPFGETLGEGQIKIKILEDK